MVAFNRALTAVSNLNATVLKRSFQTSSTKATSKNDDETSKMTTTKLSKKKESDILKKIIKQKLNPMAFIELDGPMRKVTSPSIRMGELEENDEGKREPKIEKKPPWSKTTNEEETKTESALTELKKQASKSREAKKKVEKLTHPIINRVVNKNPPWMRVHDENEPADRMAKLESAVDKITELVCNREPENPSTRAKKGFIDKKKYLSSDAKFVAARKDPDSSHR
jgi:hypothetical protein